MSRHVPPTREQALRGGLGRRLLGASAVLAVAVGAILAALVYIFDGLRESGRLSLHSQEVLATSSNLEGLVIDMETGVRGFLITGEERFLEPWERSLAVFPREAARLERLVADNPDQRALVARLRARLDAYVEDYAVPLVAAARDDPGSVSAGPAVAEAKSRLDEIRADFDELSARERALGAEREDRAEEDARRATFVSAVGLAGTAAVILLFALYLVRSMVTPIGRVAVAAGELRGGDLSVRVAETAPGEVGELGRAFNAMAASLEQGRARLEEERRFAVNVLSDVGDGVFLVDEEGVVRLWNRAAEAAAGLAAGDVLGRPAAEALPGWRTIADRVPVTSEPGVAAARSETLPLELGGREVWLSLSAVRSPEGTVYTFRDLTEEHRVERLKSDFVATVSHELRTPLAAVYGAALTLQRGDIELDREQREPFLRMIASESQRLSRIVSDLLSASRLDSGQEHLTIERCDAGRIVRDVVDDARRRLPDGLEIELRADGSLPPVAADPQKLRQVLVNIVENAVKYSPDGGRIAVALEPAGPRLRFSVRDEGLGIPPAEQPRVFEKFYRLDPQMTRGVGGTGLGLYISRELVRRMDGRIWVSSELGRGSTFYLELPLA